MKEHKEEMKHSVCPYCDEEIMTADFPFCQACRITVFYCPECQQSLPRDSKVCPSCGAKSRGETIKED
ncbi:zinc ribbon domain-containing protein [Chloroflexota bacterium]